MALGAQVLFHGQGFIEALRLEDHAHLAAHRGGVEHHVVPGNQGTARGGDHHGGENAEERGFAATVGPQQAKDFALAHFETDVRKRHAVAIAMGQVLNLDHRPGLSKSISP